jgi:hypothetical protein
MRVRKKIIYLPVISLAALLSLIYIIFSLPPSFELNLNYFTLPILPISFLLFFIFIWSLVAFIFISKVQGFLFAIFPTVYLLLRFFKLDQLLFLVLLILLFVGTELLFYRKH